MRSNKSLKSYRVVIPAGRKSYYLIYRPGRGKPEIWTTLDTLNESQAKSVAKLKWSAICDEQWDALRSTKKRQEACASIGAACDAYEIHSHVKHPKHAVSALLRIVMAATGMDRDAARAARLDRLTGDLVEQYLAARSREGASPYGVNTQLAAAKAVFRNPGRHLPGIKIPAVVAQFRSAHGMDNVRDGLTGFVPIPPDLIERMDTAADSHRADSPDVWKCYVLMRRCGMRPIEVWQARTHWLERDASGRATLALRDRPDEGFVLKNSVARFIGLDDTQASVFAGDPGAFVICPGASLTARQNFVQRVFSSWVRQFLPSRRSSAYELRRLSGSEVMERDGIEAARYFLGHTDIQTTQRWYVAWTKRVEAPGERANIASAEDLRAAAHAMQAAVASGDPVAIAAAQARLLSLV